MGIVQCDGVVIVVVSEHGGGLVRESSLGLCESTKGLVCNVAGSDGEFVVVTGRGEVVDGAVVVMAMKFQVQAAQASSPRLFELRCRAPLTAAGRSVDSAGELTHTACLLQRSIKAHRKCRGLGGPCFNTTERLKSSSLAWRLDLMPN